MSRTGKCKSIDYALPANRGISRFDIYAQFASLWWFSMQSGYEIQQGLWDGYL